MAGNGYLSSIPLTANTKVVSEPSDLLRAPPLSLWDRYITPVKLLDALALVLLVFYQALGGRFQIFSWRNFYH